MPGFCGLPPVCSLPYQLECRALPQPPYKKTPPHRPTALFHAGHPEGSSPCVTPETQKIFASAPGLFTASGISSSGKTPSPCRTLWARSSFSQRLRHTINSQRSAWVPGLNCAARSSARRQAGGLAQVIGKAPRCGSSTVNSALINFSALPRFRVVWATKATPASVLTSPALPV